jgi:DNA-binding transcriptional LysR family regulator
MYFGWLKTFKAVIDEGSYTKAAEAQFISQPAASQQVRRLERIFGAQLITRSGRDLRLTPEGQEVYKLAQSMEDEFEAAKERVKERMRSPEKLVTVVSSTTPLVHRVPPIMKRFWAEFPDVSLKTLLRLGDAINEAVKSGQADIGLTGRPDAALQASPLESDPVVCVCAPINELAAEVDVDAATLARQRIAMLGPNALSRIDIDRWFGERGLSIGANVLEVAGIEEIRSAAIENVAIGFLAHYVVDDDLQRGRLVRLNIHDFHLFQTLFVVSRPNLRPPARRLASLLLEEYGPQ